MKSFTSEVLFHLGTIIVLSTQISTADSLDEVIEIEGLTLKCVACRQVSDDRCERVVINGLSRMPVLERCELLAEEILMELSVAEYRGEYPTTEELIQYHGRKRVRSDRLTDQIERLLMVSDLGRSYLSKIGEDREHLAGVTSEQEALVGSTQLQDRVIETANAGEAHREIPVQPDPPRRESSTFVWGFAALSVGAVLYRRGHRHRLGERERLALLQTFGLGPDAGKEEVKRAFRLQAKSSHPDLKGTTEEFAALHRRYRRLPEITKP